MGKSVESIRKASKSEKLSAIEALLVEIESRAMQKGVRVDRSRFVGRKRDFLLLVQKRKLPGQEISEASLEEYMRTLRVRFPTGSGSEFLRVLFPENF